MMTALKRFAFGAALIAGLAASTVSKAATANEDYPNRMISLICALPPGTGADIIVRYFAEKLGQLVPVSVIVENRAGAGGNIAAEYVARAKPDGYTIYLHGANGIAVNLNRLKHPQFKAEDLQVVSNVQRQAFFIGVSTTGPIKTLRDLTEAMKKKGDKASYASSSTFGQIVGELYKIKMGLDPTLVQYRTSSQAMNDMNSGAVDYGVWDPVFGMSQAREGRIRLLGISSGERMDIAPDIPTMIEGGVPGMDMRSWFATMVPAATPRPIVDKLNALFNQILSTEETRKFLATAGGVPFIVTPDEGQAMYMKANVDYKELVRQANISEN
jgi:tripartite-type tricarboxylate transporter receptor subunit TctC